MFPWIRNKILRWMANLFYWSLTLFALKGYLDNLFGVGWAFGLMLAVCLLVRFLDDMKIVKTEIGMKEVGDGN